MPLYRIEFEDTKDVIRRKRDKIMANEKRTNNDQQNIIHSKLKIEIEILLKVA
jgi:hypothetical protein